MESTVAGISARFLGEVNGVAFLEVQGGLIERLFVCQDADLFHGPGAVLGLDLVVLVGLVIARGLFARLTKTK